MRNQQSKRKYLDQMQQGMYLALEAAHHLGGQMTITYTPKKTRKESAPLTDRSSRDITARVEEAKRRLAMYKDMLNGMANKQIAEKYNFKVADVLGAFLPVQVAVEKELKRSCYTMAPYQPKTLDERGKPIYSHHVRDLRPHKDFLLDLIAKANEAKFMATILNYV